jgi:hypothetical protein
LFHFFFFFWSFFSSLFSSRPDLFLQFLSLLSFFFSLLLFIPCKRETPGGIGTAASVLVIVEEVRATHGLDRCDNDAAVVCGVAAEERCGLGS